MPEVRQGGHGGGLRGQQRLIHLLETLEVSNRVRAELGVHLLFPVLLGTIMESLLSLHLVLVGSLADGLGNAPSGPDLA